MNMRIALLTLAACGSSTAAQTEPSQPESSALETEVESEGLEDTGVVRVRSAHDFTTTLAKLEAAIASRDMNVMARVDHAANAAANELELPPTTLLIFGKPQVGTLLMQNARTIGMDLPQKALVYEEAGIVYVATNDPTYLAQRHGVTEMDELLTRVTGALGGIVMEATE